MNIKKTSILSLLITSTALFSCSKNEYAKGKEWVKEHYTNTSEKGSTIDGLGGVEIFDFRETTDPKGIEVVKKFIASDYKKLPEQYKDKLYGACEYVTEGDEYYKDLDILNESTFENIMGTEEQFKAAKCSITTEGSTLYLDYEQKRPGLDNVVAQVREIFNKDGVEFYEYYSINAKSESGAEIKGYTYSLFITPQFN